MPRLSSPLDAKASVRSPYALDRSQQNPRVGTVVSPGTKPGQRPHMRFVICLLGQTLQLPGGSGQTLQFTMSLNQQRLGQLLETRISAIVSLLATAQHPQRNGAGGARRDRTDDLMLAKHALYQLSYGPAVAVVDLSARGVTRKKVWWAQADSNCRPHAYQACALTC